MAVYTHITENDLRKFLSDYSIGALVSWQGIEEGVENTNYRITTTQDSYILALYEKRINPVELPFFIQLMQHLANRGVACPLPIAARDGHCLRDFMGRKSLLVSFLQGKGMADLAITPLHCAALGAAIAGLHLATADFTGNRANALSLRGWQNLVTTIGSRADEFRPQLAQLLKEEIGYLTDQWNRVESLPKGIIHADLFPDNVFFIDTELSGLIDFYFACNDFYAYELAVVINAWCFDFPEVTGGEFRFNHSKSEALLQSYDHHKPISVTERAALPLLLRGAALRFLLTRLYDWLHQPPGALVKVKDSNEYLAKLLYFREASQQ